MKKIKYLPPALVLVFAASAAFTTRFSESAIEFAPNHFESLNGCASCEIPSAPGDIYAANYGCETLKVSNTPCTCFFPKNVLRNATSHGMGGTSCIPLWRYEIVK